jgi:hemoglobin
MFDIANDIGIERVQRVVDDFYDAVQRHPKLREPFGIVDDWSEHKAHLTHFWWVSLGGKPYRSKPYQVAVKHMEAGFTPELLRDWLALFRETLDRQLPKDLADQWYARATNIGRSLELMHESRRDA